MASTSSSSTGVLASAAGQSASTRAAAAVPAPSAPPLSLEEAQRAALKNELGELEKIIAALTGTRDVEAQAVLQSTLVRKEQVLAAIRDLKPRKIQVSIASAERDKALRMVTEIRTELLELRKLAELKAMQPAKAEAATAQKAVDVMKSKP